jgi:hypothetical protein
MEQICGFMVVRKPKYATGVFHTLNYELGDRNYLGVDRLPWEDLDVSYYRGEVPTSFLEIMELLRTENKDYSGLPVLKDYEKAVDVWLGCRETSDIIAIWSPELSKIKGSFPYSGNLRYLGLDCFALGEWSVILRGIFAKPDRFVCQTNYLNENGLLFSCDCQSILNRYVDLARENELEPLSNNAEATCLSVFLCDASYRVGT